MRKTRAWLVGAVIAVLGWSTVQTAPAARAEEPLDLDAQISDDVGAITDREDQVQAAVDRLLADHRQRLYVVYVDDFSGWDAQEWADETASRNELAVNDALLAVATTERVYALSVDPEFPLTSRDAADIEQVAIEPALRASDWAAAAIAAATALGDVSDGADVQPPNLRQATPAPTDDDSGVGAWAFVAGGVAVVAVVAVAAGAVWWWLVRRRRVQPPVQGQP